MNFKWFFEKKYINYLLQSLSNISDTLISILKLLNEYLSLLQLSQSLFYHIFFRYLWLKHGHSYEEKRMLRSGNNEKIANAISLTTMNHGLYAHQEHIEKLFSMHSGPYSYYNLKNKQLIER